MRIASLAALFALAGCGGNAQQEAAAPLATETPAAVPSGAAEPLANPTPEARLIPVQFLGVWDTQTGDCDPASDLRLEISKASITFYESVGTVQGVRDDAGTTLVTLAMQGEGERWTQTLGLRFFDAGTSLMVIDPECPGDAEQNIRKRCFD